MHGFVFAAMLVASGAAWADGCYKAAPNPGYADAGHPSPCGPDDQWTGDDLCCPPGYFHLYDWQKAGEWTGMGGKYGFPPPPSFYADPAFKTSTPGDGLIRDGDGSGAPLPQCKMVSTWPLQCDPTELLRGISPMPPLPRTYTPDELDRMRVAIGKVLPWATCYGVVGCEEMDRIYRAMIEDRLRTDVIAGISPDALELSTRGASMVATTNSGSNAVITSPETIKTVTIGNGPDEGKRVTIHLDTGKVDYPATPDEAARMFWAAVQQQFPQCLKEIRQ